MEIILTQGFVTEIDNCDEDLFQYEWRVNNGYVVRTIHDDCNDIYIIQRLSEVILERKLGRYLKEGLICDHINQNKLDNRRENLREVTYSINTRNRYLQNNNTSGVRGAYKRGDRWEAAIVINKEYIYIGTFSSKEKAERAYLMEYYENYKEYPPEFEKGATA